MLLACMNSHWRKLLLIFPVLFSCFFKGYAQSDSTNGAFDITIEGHYGFIMAHRPSIISLQDRHLGGVVVAISKPSNGKKQWQHQYHLPHVGIKYGFFGLGNKEKLGYGHTIYPYVDIPLGSGRKHFLNLQLGWGIGYITKPFDRFENYKNMAIGSHLNAVIAINFNKDIKITSRDKLKTGIGITHFSNGSLVIPNLGINITTLQLHYIHSFGKKKEIAPYKHQPFHRSYRKAVFIAAGMRQIPPSGGKNYFIASMSGNMFKQYSERAAAGIGLDYFYDDSNNEKLRRLDVKPQPFLSASRIGLAGGYEVIMSDFSITLQLGAYIKSQLKSDGSFYSRIGIRYLFNKHMFATVNLKTHWGKADFGEWGVGYKF